MTLTNTAPNSTTTTTTWSWWKGKSEEGRGDLQQQNTHKLYECKVDKKKEKKRKTNILIITKRNALFSLN